MIIFCAFILLLSGCDTSSILSAPAQHRGYRGFFQDNMIRIALNKKFLLDKDTSNVDIMVHRGTVLLMGFAHSQNTIDRFIHQARNTAHVKKVISEVKVFTPRSTLVHNVYLAEKLRAKLFFNTQIQSQNFHIRVIDRIAYILGTAATENEKTHVIQQAEKFPLRKIIAYIDVHTK